MPDLEKSLANLKVELEKHTTSEKTVLTGLLGFGIDGWWDWKIRENVEYYSPKFRELLGFESEEDFPNVPESWQKQLHPEDLEKATKMFTEHVESQGRVPYKLVVRYFRKDGEMIHVLCRGSVVSWSPNGTARRMVGTHILLSDVLDLDE